MSGYGIRVRGLAAADSVEAGARSARRAEAKRQTQAKKAGRSDVVQRGVLCEPQALLPRRQKLTPWRPQCLHWNMRAASGPRLC